MPVRVLTSQVAVGTSSRAYSYRDLDAVLSMPDTVPRPPKLVEIPPDTRPGLLSALSDVLRRDAAAWRRQPAGTCVGCAVAFTHDGRVYDLFMQDSDRTPSVRIRDRRYPDAVEADLVIVNRSTGGRTRFGVTYALVDGREVPTRVVYRPKWWLEIELAIDDAAPF